MANQPLKIIQDTQKQMPCNIEAEQALIGLILVSNDIYDEISGIVDAQKFFDPIHIKIFETIEKLIAKGLLANPITLKNYFENNEGLKELGGQEYLVKITKYSTSVKQAIDYANIVQEMHVRRELIKISENVLSSASNSNNDSVSNFEFVYTDICGKIMNWDYEMCPELEGTLVFFPSDLNHQVYPFYNCSEERVSISGNIMLNTAKLL